MTSPPAALLRCPSCGSRAKATEKGGEFICPKCQTRFQLVTSAPSDSPTKAEPKAERCGICNRDLRLFDTTYRCSECGKTGFCSSCVVMIGIDGRNDERALCRICMNRKGLACLFCNNYAARVCVSCSRRACGIHESGFFDLAIASFLTGSKIYNLNCPTCKQVCVDCTETKSHPLGLRRKFSCIKCGNDFEPPFELGKSCNFCGQVIPKKSEICPHCGKPRVSIRLFLQLRRFLLTRSRKTT